MIYNLFSELILSLAGDNKPLQVLNSNANDDLVAVHIIGCQDVELPLRFLLL